MPRRKKTRLSFAVTEEAEKLVAVYKPRRDEREAGGAVSRGDLPDAGVHDLAAAEQAAAELSKNDFLYLYKVGINLIESHELDPAPRNQEDLVAEAVARTLSGSRKWRRGVDFRYHLVQTMRSIASQWTRRAVRETEAGAQEYAESLWPEDEDEVVIAPWNHVASSLPSPERLTVARDRVRRIEKHFAGEPISSQVIACLKLGMTGSETREETGMSQRDYATAMQKIRRFVRRGGKHGR